MVQQFDQRSPAVELPLPLVTRFKGSLAEWKRELFYHLDKALDDLKVAPSIERGPLPDFVPVGSEMEEKPGPSAKPQRWRTAPQPQPTVQPRPLPTAQPMPAAQPRPHAKPQAARRLQQPRKAPQAAPWLKLQATGFSQGRQACKAQAGSPSSATTQAALFRRERRAGSTASQGGHLGHNNGRA